MNRPYPNRAPADAAIAATVFLASLAFLLWFEPLARPRMLDAATWDYMSVEVSRGLVVYRDVFLHKTPGAAWLGALGVWLGGWLGPVLTPGWITHPVHGAHVLFLVLASAAPALLFLVCRRRLPVASALAAAVLLIALDPWPFAALQGVRPKIATVTLGLAALLAVQRRRVFLAGVLAGASALCWQPGVVFLLGAGGQLVAGGWLSGLPGSAGPFGNLMANRDGFLRSSLWLGLGSAAGPVIAVLYLGWNGALADAWAQAVVFNREYVETMARTPVGTMLAVAGELWRWALAEVLLASVLVSVLNASILRGRREPSGKELPASVRQGEAEDSGAGGLNPEEIHPDGMAGLLVAGAAYALLLFASFQSWPDLLLILPAVAAALAVGMLRVERCLVAAWPGARLGELTAGYPGTTSLVLALFVLMLPGRSLDVPKVSFAMQAEQVRELAGDLPPESRIVAISAPEVLLHTGHRNTWRWPYLWSGVDAFAVRTEMAAMSEDERENVDGGMNAAPLLRRLEAIDPSMIVLGRRWSGPLRHQFNAWAEERFEYSEVEVFPHTRRPLRVWRAR